MQAAVGERTWDAYERFVELVHSREPLELRDLVELTAPADPVPVDEVEPEESILRRFSSGGMSHGSLSAGARDGRRGVQPGRRALELRRGRRGSGAFPPERNSRIKQVASARFGVTAEYAVFAEELQIKIAQGVEAGRRRTAAGPQGHRGDRAAPPHAAGDRPDLAAAAPTYSIEDLAQLIFDLRQVNPDAAVSVKLVAEAGVGMVAAGVVKALADVVHIAGADGGTGASPLSSIKNAGAPWELGLVETQRTLVEQGLRDRVRLRVDGGLKTGRDVIVAALLGADEVSFGTVLLLAQGCLMVRSCHLDTCPVRIATQRPELRAKFAASPEDVETYLRFVAQEVRVHLASLGLQTCLRRGRGSSRAAAARPAGRADVTPLLVPAGRGYGGEAQLEAPGGELGERLAADAAAILEDASARPPLPDLDLRPCRGRGSAERSHPVSAPPAAGPRACWLRRLGRPELRRVPDHRDQARARRQRGERLRRQVDERGPHRHPAARRRRGRPRADRQHGAVRRDGRRAVLRRPRGRTARGAQLRCRRRRRGGATTRAST